MVNRNLFAAIVMVFVPFSALADAVTDVIERQLDAFIARDIGTAWEQASPMIHRQMRDPRTFAAMVEMGYAPIWNNADARFSSRTTRDGQVQQVVVITDDTGATQAFEYDMIETGAGWKINGVRPVEMPDAAV
ncbi:DUF4864 domain-containing protein [Celeribacter marinus]|uniref:Uncharacterized protein n=1 Tax=Celeribacter marinus TaxID=1397108 RepID=A0A0P0ACW6_9RHOB|nr:DUF4864 domain-containing protein [Celeribacter marinus]ALI56784.1 Hypothetical protein IMCC12053_2837 [Celeribacter marinus]SFL00296.1 protein of unknown function [Celeribacter marinus]